MNTSLMYKKMGISHVISLLMYQKAALISLKAWIHPK